LNETYRICIIDDMEDAVESLVKNIAWSDCDIRVCGTATNGRDGLELVLYEKPDIVLTDIRMPQMDGLEMVARLLKELPNCKVIIMSGFFDFEYAQKALRLGALDYLTKPLTPQELDKTMKKVVEQLKAERELQDQTLRLEQKFNESMPLFKYEQLNLLIRYETSREAAEDRWHKLNLEMGNGRFAVMVAEIDNWSLPGDQIRIQEVEMARFAIQNIWEETVCSEATGIVFPDAYTNRLVCIINFMDELNLEMIGERGRINIQNHSKNTVSIGVSDIVTIENLPQAYNQALTALSYNFYTGGNSIFCFSDHQFGGKGMVGCESEKEKELLLSLRAGNQEKMALIMNEIVDHFCDSEPSLAPNEIISRINELIVLIKRELQEAVPLHHLDAINEEFALISRTHVVTVHQLKQLLLSICEFSCGLIHREQESETTRLVNVATQYIDSNLGENLTIGDYAAYVHLSTSYFASLFKKTKGLTVHQYVIREKINLAKKMLLQDKMVQEIAGELGFEDRRYFTEVFKKLTGVTPTQYSTEVRMNK
jgi:two-component system response regulator YesN